MRSCPRTSPQRTSTKKIVNYLEAGTHTVWAIWPRSRHALAYHRQGGVQHVALGEKLEAPAVIPGAGILLDDIFAQII